MSRVKQKKNNKPQSKQTSQPTRKKGKRRGLIIGICAVAVIAVLLVVLLCGGKEKYTAYADIVIEDYGTVTVGLCGKAAPQTVDNFISLAESGFYDGLTFHRIMEGFMMQGGAPNGDGTAVSVQNIYGEFADNGFDNPLSHTRGAVSMARANDYNSGSSQFFIVHQDNIWLDGQYAAFGYVTEGMEVVDAVCEAAEPLDNNGKIASEQQPVISSVSIRSK